MESPQSRPHLGKYTLVAEIARGGMGIVYLGQMSGPAGFQKLVVIKQLKPELGEDEKYRGMFLDEARLAARLNHRNIVQTNEVGEDDGRYFMAMEYLEGRTLQSVRNRLKGEKALSAPTLLRIACDVLAGLHYAHELKSYDGSPLGIVHRDVSPQNVFLTYDGQVKVLDFGVAKALGNTQETQAGMLKGRVVCMSPEHVGNDLVDRRADVFSMGVMLRETLTGKRLWDGVSEMDILKDLLARRIPPFPDDTDLPDALRVIIEKAMAPKREDRFATANDMRLAIEPQIARLDPSGSHSLATMGERISTEFADHRERVKTAVEQHVANRPKSSGDFFPAVELPMLPISGHDLGVSSPTSSPSISELQSLKSAASGASVASAGTVIAGELAAPLSVQPRQRRGPSLILVGITVVALAVAGGAILLRGRGQTATATATAPPPTDVTPAPPLSASPPATTPQADVVELTVRASPANAQIFIDEANVTENPWRAKYPRGGQHSVRVVAPGHVPKSETVTLSEAMSMSVSLEKQGPGTTTVVVAAAPPRPAVLPPPPRAAGTPAPASDPRSTEAIKPSNAAPPPAPPPPTPNTSEIVHGGGKAPKRNIDQKNPYQ